ncbi:MAG: hypothetical protein Q9227_002135 [Pyrenula ochraceoflavens]
MPRDLALPSIDHVIKENEDQKRQTVILPPLQVMPYDLMLANTESSLESEYSSEPTVLPTQGSPTDHRDFCRSTSCFDLKSSDRTKSLPRRFSWLDIPAFAKQKIRRLSSSAPSKTTSRLLPERTDPVRRHRLIRSVSDWSLRKSDQAEGAREKALDDKRSSLLAHARHRSLVKLIEKPLPQLPEEDGGLAKVGRTLPTADLNTREGINPSATKPFPSVKSNPASIPLDDKDALFQKLLESTAESFQDEYDTAQLDSLATLSPASEMADPLTQTSSLIPNTNTMPSVPPPSPLSLTSDESPPTTPAPLCPSPLRLSRSRSSLSALPITTPVLTQPERQTPNDTQPSITPPPRTTSLTPLCVHLQYTYRECRCTITCLRHCSCTIPRACLDRIQNSSTQPDTTNEGETRIVTQEKDFLDPICYNCLMDEIFGKDAWEWEDSGNGTPRSVKAWSPSKTEKEIVVRRGEQSLLGDGTPTKRPQYPRSRTVGDWELSKKSQMRTSSLLEEDGKVFGAVELDGEPTAPEKIMLTGERMQGEKQSRATEDGPLRVYTVPK